MGFKLREIINYICYSNKLKFFILLSSLGITKFLDYALSL